MSTRIAIVDADKCKPRKCRQECKKFCPVVRMGKLCIEVAAPAPAAVSESLCIGCGICVKKCPFGALNIINLPKGLESKTIHRFGPNTFKLHGLPTPRAGEVLGLVGANGTGKSTALKILAKKIRPNLGKYMAPPEWPAIVKHFRGSELQAYFKGEYKVVIKPQYVDKIAAAVTSSIVSDHVTDCSILSLETLKNREIKHLSGGELQRFAIAAALSRLADVYMFDEPSSYLDIKQRVEAARVIRGALSANTFIIAVEHDLSILDYLSDSICCLYGTAGAYGVVTMPFSVREGINIFLAGFDPAENVRFRQESLTFKIADPRDDEMAEIRGGWAYARAVINKGNFNLIVEAGDFRPSEILVLLGQNGAGKTTFINALAGEHKVSFKPQIINAAEAQTVREFIGAAASVLEILRPLSLESLMDEPMSHLSGGELQRVWLARCLSTPADIYLIDEPSAHLDSEQRIAAAKVIKRFMLQHKKTAFVVEHDFIMATYLADRVIVFEGAPAIKCRALSPRPLVAGMNKFLADLEVTFRRDPLNWRPRINKLNSLKDREQKAAGAYFYTAEND